MKKAVYASLFHNSDLEEVKRHQFCPKGKESWCKWRRQREKDIQPLFKPKLNISEAIHKMILPVFRKLSKDDLLKRCLHGKTQNANESLNGLIWQRCPKAMICGRKTVEIAAASAVIHFNDGPAAMNSVLSRLGISKCFYCTIGYEKKERKRKRSIEVKNTDKSKQRRKQLRALKKGWQDKEMEEEGETYAAGKF